MEIGILIIGVYLFYILCRLPPVSSGICRAAWGRRGGAFFSCKKIRGEKKYGAYGCRRSGTAKNRNSRKRPPLARDPHTAIHCTFRYHANAVSLPNMERHKRGYIPGKGRRVDNVPISSLLYALQKKIYYENIA